MSDKINTKILIAPLDWGLGHATRCIPIIHHLIRLNCKVIIAAEGAQQKLLKTEFPHLTFVDLPGYRINYSNNKRFFLLKILLQVPKMLLAIRRENKWLQRFMVNSPVDAVISDNRYGLYHKSVTSVFITHQLLIKAPFGIAERMMQKINYKLIQKFTECWVPDEKGPVNLAGKLSHPARLPKIPVKYLGGLSRLEKKPNCEKKFAILIILSGPEPQRTSLENKLLAQLEKFAGAILFIRGLPGNEELMQAKGNITYRNHLAAKELETAFCESELIISRSGYTTVMDICKIEKKSALIPTPGQTEQEYLAKHLEKQGWCVAAEQENFSLDEILNKVKNFDYTFPGLNMEEYKSILDEFVKSIPITD